MEEVEEEVPGELTASEQPAQVWSKFDYKEVNTYHFDTPIEEHFHLACRLGPLINIARLQGKLNEHTLPLVLFLAMAALATAWQGIFNLSKRYKEQAQELRVKSKNIEEVNEDEMDKNW